MCVRGSNAFPERKRSSEEETTRTGINGLAGPRTIQYHWSYINDEDIVGGGGKNYDGKVEESKRWGSAPLPVKDDISVQYRLVPV